MDSTRFFAALLVAICAVTFPASAVEVKEAEKGGVRLVLGTSSVPETLGEMVPFGVIFEAPLKKGEKLTVFADATHLAYVITPKEGFLLREFRGRVRMNNGALRLVVERNDGKLIEIAQNIVVDRPYSIPKTGKPSKEFRVRGKGNRIELIHTNTMSLANYVKQIDINASGNTLTIAMTPYSSGWAYYLIEAGSSLDGANVDIQVADTLYQLTE